jgi:hypothetical protein
MLNEQASDRAPDACQHQQDNKQMIPRSRRLLAAMAAAPLLAFMLAPAPGHAQRTGPFANLHGAWNGGGTITMSSGAKERIRCRANYKVESGGSSLSLELRCASDSYRFELQSNITLSGSEISGTWSESANRAAGAITGTATGNQMQLRATGSTFSALLGITSAPTKQTISISSPGSEVSAVAISLNKGGG